MQRRASKKNKHWTDALPRDACSKAVAWARTQESAEAGWRNCKRGDWMLWLIDQLDKSKPFSEERKPLVRVACECAREAWQWMPHKSRDALKVIERWTRGEVSEKDCLKAGAAQAAAAAAAAAAADAARIAMQARCADIVRRHYPVAPKLIAMQKAA